MMPRLKLEGVGVQFAGLRAVSDVSFEVAPGQICAVIGPNGAGKSTLLTSLKSAVKTRAYYWPTADRLAFAFAQGQDEIETDEDGDPLPPSDTKRPGFSSGERQIRALQEIVRFTDAPIYLLDEWDANLDANNRAAADALVEELARRARVVEISHRDRT
jgi:ABC-type multidrug transport system ATPase subunit